MSAAIRISYIIQGLAFLFMMIGATLWFDAVYHQNMVRAAIDGVLTMVNLTMFLFQFHYRRQAEKREQGK